MAKAKTGRQRTANLRLRRRQWLIEHAHGLSPEGLLGALMRGEVVLQWVSEPTGKRAPGRKLKKGKS